MKTNAHDLLRAGALLICAALTLPGLALAGDADETSLTAVIGGQSVNDLGRGTARFERYRDVPDGAVFEYGRFEWLPKDKSWALSVSAFDAFRKDQRYRLLWSDPARFTLKLGYSELPRFFSSGSTTLYQGVGTSQLTIPESMRLPIEAVGTTGFQPQSAFIGTVGNTIAASSQFIDLRTQRKAATGALDVKLSDSVSLQVAGRYERRDGTKPLGFGTYIRRQGLTGVSGTGAGFFWRETVEARGQELVEPLDYTIPELNLSATWAKKGNSVVVGWEGSWFRNGITALYFDSPFEAPSGRASATIFDPRSEQEPAAPNGNNQLRGLYARSVMQLPPENSFNQVYGNASFKLGQKTRLTAALSRGSIKQNDAFLPYAENDQVVFSGTVGQPGVVSAHDAALPQKSLDGKIDTTRADFKLTSRPTDALSLRALFRYYGYDDKTPAILFPGFSSSGDSYFRPGIGQKDAAGNRILESEPGGYTRQRFGGGAAYRVGKLTLDAEYTRTRWDYDARQVDKTDEDTLKGTVRLHADNGVQVSAYYLAASRDFSGSYAVGLETSGVRAFDVWKRDRNQAGADLEFPAGENWNFNVGGSYAKDDYPGAVETFAYGYGLQDTKSSSVYGGASYSKGDWTLGAWSGFDSSAWNSLQVTKTSLGADYNPIDRWTRGLADDVFSVGFNVIGKLGKKTTLRADLDYQKFSGDWTTANLDTPDVNSAVAYAFPELSDKTLSARVSLVWNVSPKVDLEARYWYEPYRLDDFTWNNLQPYMQGVLQETQGSPTAVGPMNVSRLLWLDSRYADYTAHTVSAFLHVRF